MSLPKQIPNEIRELVCRYADQHPYLSARRLSNLIVNEENAGYTTDTLRIIVSAVLNERQTKSEIDFENLYGEMPATWYEEPTDYEVPTQIKKLGIINDVHVPYHDPKAVKIAVEYLQEVGIDCLLLNGDIADMHADSRYVKDPRYRDTARELEMVNQFLDYLQGKFDRIIYKFGNHEARLENKVALDKPEWAGLDGLTLQENLKLAERKIAYIESKRVIKFGKLNIIHGDELPGGGAINTARNKLLKSFDNVLYGHHHATQETTQNTLGRDIIGSFGVGCLCGLRPRYMPNNNWNHGFAIVTLDEEGFFRVENLRITNNKIV